MAELPTIKIHSLKDPRQSWVINLEDFDGSIHTEWDASSVEKLPTDDPSPVVDSGSASSPDTEHQETRTASPSVPDFVYDEAGEITVVNIINPDRQTSRLQISAADYNPDIHQLWSMHPRFQER